MSTWTGWAERVVVPVLVGTALVAGAPLAGQGWHRPGLTLGAGVAPYDLSGTGTTFVVAAGVDYPLNSFLLVEPGVRYLRYRTQGDETTTFLLPEVSVQIQAPLAGVRPYLGVGAGGSFIVQGRSDTDATLHAAVGVRIPVRNRWSVRTEARLRAVDPFVGNTFDVTAGVRRSF